MTHDNEEHLHNVKVKTELWKNSDGMHINLVTDFSGIIFKKVIALEEEATREALIRIGWKPPDCEGVSTRATPAHPKAAQNDEALNYLNFIEVKALFLKEDREKALTAISEIEAALQQTPPDGYVLVPVEYSDKFEDALLEGYEPEMFSHCGCQFDAEIAYKAMITAATKEKDQK